MILTGIRTLKQSQLLGANTPNIPVTKPTTITWTTTGILATTVTKAMLIIRSTRAMRDTRATLGTRATAVMPIMWRSSGVCSGSC